MKGKYRYRKGTAGIGFGRIFLLILLLTGISGNHARAQKQANFWYFGKNAALDFTGFDPIPLNNSAMNSPVGAAAISDSTGQLLFYTDGLNIWNSIHQKVNTSDLSGDPSSTQSATIVPDPDIPDEYFVFTTRSFITGNANDAGGNFYKIRMKAGETGSIIYDNAAATGKPGMALNTTEKFCAVPYQRPDGKTGYWFLMHEFNSARFIKIKYDGTLQPPVYQTIGSVHQNDTIDDGTNRGAAGQMKVNDMGTRLALAVEGGKFFEIFRFNAETGLISGDLKIPAGDSNDKFAFKYGACGVEFSPTSRPAYETETGNFLYGSARDGGLIYQWDLSFEYDWTQFIKNGQVKFNNPGIRCGEMQMAPNAKIYVAMDGRDYLGVISSPMHPDCKFEERGARLIDNETGLGGSSGLGLPAAIPVRRRPEPFYFDNLCLGSETLFYITDQLAITPSTPRAWTIIPLFGGNPVTKTSQTNELRFRFLKAGDYRIRLTAFISGTPVPFERTLTIHALPVVQLIKDNIKDTVQLCRGSSIEMDAGYGAFYAWETDTINSRRRTISNVGNEFYHEYRVQVTDYHGCVGWDTVTIRREIPPTATHTSVKAFCGRGDGSATVIPNGNIANFTYTWENYPNEKSNTLSGINGGDYIVHVYRPSTTCSVTDTIHVEELGGSSVKIVSSSGPVVCPGTRVTLTVPSAAEIEWISPAGLSGNSVNLTVDTTTVIRINAISRDGVRECPTQVADTIRVFPKNPPELGADLTPCGGNPVFIDGGENYIAWNWSDGQTKRFAEISGDNPNLVLRATDPNQCVFSDSLAIRFLPGPTVNLGKDTVVCSKEPITLYGGTGDSYLWSTGETKDSIRVSKTDHYWLTITKDGCSLTDTIYVQFNDPDLFKIDSVNVKNISCHGADDGSIRVFASGDGRKFFYSIDNGLTYLDNGGIFDNLKPDDSYVVKVSEDSSCTQIWPVAIPIIQPDSLGAKFCTLPPSCRECTDGMIIARITGGTKPYVIRLNGSIQDSVIGDLGFGNFSLTVTDAHDCTVTSSVVLAQGTRPEIVADLNNPVCSGTAVTLRVDNSSQVEWINPPGSYNLEIVVHPEETTTYQVKSIKTDADNFVCETILEYTVQVIPFVKPELGPDLLACMGDTVQLDGGDYVSWEWSNGMTGRYILLFESPPVPIVLTVTDIHGCLLKDSISVRFSPHPLVDLGPDRTLCQSEPLVLSGGNGDGYLWSTSDTTQTLSVSASGKYRLTITTAGCSTSDSVNIRILDPNTFTINSVTATDNTCFGGEIGSIEIDVSDSGNAFEYSIDGGGTYQSSNLFGNLPSGEYDRIRVRKDSLCTKDYPETVTISQPDSIHITYRLKSPKCEACKDGKLMLDISGGRPPYTITLAGEQISLITETLGTGYYTVTVTDANLCSKTFEFTLELLNVIPNVITTNGDGVNDLWKIPLLKYYADAIVKVFDSSGKMVFVSDPGYPVPWDGRDHGNQLPMGTYYYLINLGPGEQQITGYLTILR